MENVAKILDALKSVLRVSQCQKFECYVKEKQ